MANQPHKKFESREASDGKWTLLRQKFANLFPPMRRGYHADMAHVTRNHTWFLRESRFLFFTRNGPVEITLKPAVVLASAIIGMVGVSVIFLSTIFASYSAIEVMRDETIQSAQASITPLDKNLGVNDVSSPGNDGMPVWQTDVPTKNVFSEQTGKIVGKTATSPKPSPFRFNTQPQVNAPSPLELSGSAMKNQIPIASQTVFGDGQRNNNLTSITPGKTLPAEEILDDTTSFEAVKSNPADDKPIANIALAADPAHESSDVDVKFDHTPEQSLNQTASDASANLPPPLLPDTNKSENATIRPEDDDSFVRTAAGFAIAMLPRLFPETDPAPSFADKKAELPTNTDDTDSDLLDGGLAITAKNSQVGPLLPSISDAARAQKMLLSLDGEINYIRKSIKRLGINTDYLPHYKNENANIEDTDFKSLLITLAEHRAALRKIPFKTPMLYFYISSEYGLRKHPKTGKKSFHHGIDLAGTWQENVRSTAPGTIVFAGREGAFGKVVRIEHDYGISTLYAHLSRITVSVGDYVAENAVIGKMGNTGRSAGPHLHYEIQVDGKSVDPNDFFTIGRQMSVSGELRHTSLVD